MTIESGANKKVEFRHDLAYELIESGSNVLDIGCGTGVFAKKLMEKGCKVIGCEIDRKSVKEARRNGVRVLLCDAEKDSLPKGRFDYITCLDVMEHLKQPEEFLKKLRGKSRYLILSVPNACWIKNRIIILFGSIPRANAFTKHLGSLHYWLWSYNQFKQMIEKLGFEIIEEKKIKIPNIPFFDNWFVYSYTLNVKNK